MRVTPKILVLFLGIGCLVPHTAFAQGGWIRQSIAPERDIYVVATLGGRSAVALDAQGKVLGIADGLVVYPQTSGPTSPILGLSFVNSTGTAVGDNGTILRTTDWGETWTAQSSGTTHYLIGVSLVDESIGTAVGYQGTILRTTDGGTTWTPQDSGTLFDL